MGAAYTPGLKVAKWATISKTRRLPLKGEILVKEGDTVEPETIVARAYLPGEMHIVHLRQIMGGLEPIELKEAILVKPGDEVKQGQIIASKKVFFGLFTQKATSPVDGKIEYYASEAGDLGIREKPKLLELNAYIKGTVSKVLPQEGVVVTTNGAFIQGIFGVGGERCGTIMKVAKNPNEPLTMENLPKDVKDKILVAGSTVSATVLRKLSENGAKGVICGGIINEELASFLGYEIGIAITGHEEINITIIVTEGFGRMNIAERTFKLLSELDGKRASINGATQVRAGAQRPEIIVPLQESEVPEQERQVKDEMLAQQLEIGKTIRIIRVPYFGKLAKVTELPPELQEIETKSKVRLLKAQLLDSGETVVVPRANVEIIT
ncbi:MAG: hypothetical protein N2234_02565 [Planctomycetota bacterium]|nr:hypothetical protein [Planctomycetota bacterium]